MYSLALTPHLPPTCLYAIALPLILPSVPRHESRHLHYKLVSARIAVDFKRDSCRHSKLKFSRQRYLGHPHNAETTAVLDNLGCREYQGSAVSHAHYGLRESDRPMDFVGETLRRSSVGRSSTGISRDSSGRRSIPLRHGSGMLLHENWQACRHYPEQHAFCWYTVWQVNHVIPHPIYEGENILVDS